jgi:hypothetical protein
MRAGTAGMRANSGQISKAARMSYDIFVDFTILATSMSY